MELSYKIYLKDGVFKYNCVNYSSYIKIKDKDTKKIYNILNILDDIEKLAEKKRIKR